MSTLADLTGALQALGSAVSSNDREAYLEALTWAKTEGASEEQIRDAWAYSARRFHSNPGNPASIRFDWQGALP